MSSEHEASGNRFHVNQHESLPEVLERLGGHRGETLTLVVADHSPILLTATEFRTLKDHADRQNIRLRVQTRDSLRLQLASMFGLAPPATPPESGAADDDASGRANYGSWRNVRRPRHRPPDQPPDEEHAEPNAPAATAPVAVEDPIAVSRRRRNAIYGDSMGREADDDDIVRIDDAGLDYLEDDESAGRTKAWLYGRIAAVALVALAIILAALWYWMPAVEVDATLHEAQIETGTVYSVAAPDAEVPSDAAFAVEASERSAEVPFRIEIPASGVEREPDGTASGTLTFRNVSGEPVTLEQGTELATVGGQRYLLLETVEVPAGDLENPGEAQAPVTAAEPGSGGNVETGGLTGKVPDVDVYYSNLSGPIEGGTDREFAVVTEEDVAEAERAVQEDLQNAAVEGWRDQLEEGMAVVGPSVTPGDPQYAIEGAADERRESVEVNGKVPVTGYVYSIAEVEEQSRGTFESALVEELPPGFELVPGTIQLGEPEVISEAPENVEYRVTASATARARFGEDAQEDLRERMAGSSVDEAREAVASTGAIESWDMSMDPGWWPDRMPQAADRITIDVDPSGDSGAAAAGTPVASPADDAEAEGGS